MDILKLAVLVTLVVATSKHVHALDPVTDYVIVSQSTSKQEAARCLGPGKCYLKLLTCPSSCPMREPVNPGKPACFINCQACTATCKKRIPNCYGYGAVCYDPRFIGGDGVMFYFHGKKDRDFCLISDSQFHVNAHFIGKRPEGRHRDYTWVQGLGFLFGFHRLGINAKKVGNWDDNTDQLLMSFDGDDILVEESEGATWTSPCGLVEIERTAATNSLHVVIHELVDVALNVVPITEQENRVHNYQIKSNDCFAHLQTQFSFFNLTSAVNGVLGQTYQPNFKTPVKVGVPMPIMGGDEKFLTSSLYSSDCKVSQFSAIPIENTITDLPSMEASLTIKCGSLGGAMSCRR